jgi:hypothetical protein
MHAKMVSGACISITLRGHVKLTSKLDMIKNFDKKNRSLDANSLIKTLVLSIFQLLLAVIYKPFYFLVFLHE